MGETPTASDLALATPKPELASPGGARRARVLGRLGLMGAGALLALVAFLREPRPAAADRRAAVVEILQKRGYATVVDDVVFIDGPNGVIASTMAKARVVARANLIADADGLEQPSDIFYFEARLSPGGALLDLSEGHNLSETTGAEETRPIVADERVVFASNSGIEGAPSVVSVLDFRGQTIPTDWSLMARTQHALTNYQHTGMLRGLARSTYVVEGDGEVHITQNGPAIVVETGKQRATLALADANAALPAWIKLDPTELSPPGNLTTWAVDRVRLEVGDDNMQAVKQYFFEAKDFFDRNREELSGNTGEAEILDDLGQEAGVAPRVIPVDPDLGWPPPPLEPWVDKPVIDGEGQWNAKEDAAFFRSQPNLPPTFVTTFIRSDRTRKTTRVYIAMWDPRQVELHMMAGTVEPKGATGKAGPGMIPRTPETMKRVVAATNAGFQALHGEFGMMADGVVYLPPKPFAATVMRLRDGSTAFGSWPRDTTVPDQVVSYRQNMTVMVQDEKFNPYDRTWWGGAVPGAEDKTHTVRTGMCLTREKFVGYFYGADLSPDALAQAMIQARCSYGIALDMNAGHSGMEFYRVAPEGQLPELSRALETSWEGQGSVPEMPGWEFRSKRLIKGMGLMNFPRYIKREARDYFYLTLRYVLPGENLVSPQATPPEGDGAWQVKGLPQHGFPYAIATTTIHPDKADPSLAFRVLQIDPRSVKTASASAAGNTVVTVDAGTPGTASSSAWYWKGGFSIAADSPGKGASRVAAGNPKPGKGAALLCVHPESNVLFYAEVDGAAGGKRSDLTAMAALFTGMGCVDQLALEAPLGVLLGDGHDLYGKAANVLNASSAVRFVRGEAPGGTRFFEDTPIVPRSEWYALQQARIRYFKKHDD